MKDATFFQKVYNKYQNLSIPVKASLWFVVCNIIQKVISFLTTPIFTRLLTTEQYGHFTVYSSWLGIVCIFTTLNLQYGSFNTVQVKFQDRRDAYISSIQSLVTLMTGIAVVVYFIAPSFWQDIFRMEGYLVLIMLFHILFQFSMGLWMGNKRFDYKYRPMIIVTLLLNIMHLPVGLISVLNSSDKGHARIVGAACLEMAVGCIIYLYNLFVGKKIFDKTFWKFALSFNVPLIPYYLSQVVFNFSDRIMISRLDGDDKAGIYGLAYNVAFLLSFVINSINNAFIPWFYRQIKANDGKKIKQVSEQLIMGISIMLLLFILIAPELIWFMGGQEYYEAIWVIPPVTASLLFSFYTDFTCNIEFYFEKKGLLVVGTISSAIVNIVLNYFGILRWGYLVAGYTTLIAYILFWLFLYVGAKDVCKKNLLDEAQFINFKFQFKLAILFLLLAGLIMAAYKWYLIRYGGIIFIILGALIFRKKLMNYITCLVNLKEDSNAEKNL